MKANKHLLLWSSLVALAILAGAAVKENFFRDWRVIQKKIAAQLPSSQADAFTIQLRQVVSREVGATDRCVSCHVGMCASVTNPFLTVFPRSPQERPFETRGDIECLALVGKQLAKRTGDRRFADTWKFVDEGKVEVYLQRILDHSSMTKGYQITDLEEKAKKGIPALMMSRTNPKTVGYEQVYDSRPWYTKTGRLEFYREEDEFIDAGENLPVHREPIDSTFYEPNVIVAPPHPFIKPKGPEDYGLKRNELSNDVRQGRNVVLS